VLGVWADFKCAQHHVHYAQGMLIVFCAKALADIIRENNMIVLVTGQQESGSSGLNTRTLEHARGSPPPPDIIREWGQIVCAAKPLSGPFENPDGWETADTAQYQCPSSCIAVCTKLLHVLRHSCHSSSPGPLSSTKNTPYNHWQLMSVTFASSTRPLHVPRGTGRATTAGQPYPGALWRCIIDDPDTL